jgi:hypothetical protein
VKADERIASFSPGQETYRFGSRAGLQLHNRLFLLMDLIAVDLVKPGNWQPRANCRLSLWDRFSHLASLPDFKPVQPTSLIACDEAVIRKLGDAEDGGVEFQPSDLFAGFQVPKTDGFVIGAREKTVTW